MNLLHGMIHVRLVATFFVITMLLGSVKAQAKVFDVPEGLVSHPLQDFAEYLMTDDDSMDIHQIRQSDTVWRPLVEKPNGYRDEWFWFRTQLQSNAAVDRDMVIVLKNPFLKNIEIYLARGEDGKLRSIALEEGVAEARFDITLKPSELTTIWIRTKFPFQSTVPLRIFDMQSSRKFKFIEHLYVFASLGILFGLLLYNLLFYITLRERSHLYYVIYAFAGFCIAALQSGYAQILVGENWLWLNNTVNQVACIGGVVFARHFLGAARRTPRLNRLLSLVIGISIIHIVMMWITPFAALTYGFELNLAIATFAVVSIGFVAYRQGFLPAKYYLLSFLGLVSAAWFCVCSNFGLISDGFYAPFAMNLGLIVEMNLISVALAERINMLRLELISALQNQNEELGRRVTAEAEVIKRQQITLVNSAKMSALGQMASGVAHEINNPLTIIRGRASLIRYSIESGKVLPDKFLQDLEVIDSTSLRIARITKGLLAFAGGEDNDPITRTDLKSVVEDMLRYCSEKLKIRNIAIELHSEGDTQVSCRAQQIGHVMLSLLYNAHDAILDLPEKWIKMEIIGTQKEVKVRVIDSGPGIPKNIVDRIMEPFFTTKGVGKGTGLGLSVAKGVIEEQGGRLFVDRSARNTCFEFAIPRREY